MPDVKKNLSVSKNIYIRSLEDKEFKSVGQMIADMEAATFDIGHGLTNGLKDVTSRGLEAMFFELCEIAYVTEISLEEVVADNFSLLESKKDGQQRQSQRPTNDPFASSGHVDISDDGLPF